MKKLALAAALLFAEKVVAPSRKRRKIYPSQFRQKPPSPNHQHHLRPPSLSRQRLKPLSL